MFLSRVQDDTNFRYLLCVCFPECAIFGILTMMIMVKMADLDTEEWDWFKTNSGKYSFTVGFH